MTQQIDRTAIPAAAYAALVQGAALYRQPHAGTLQISGADRADFLHRMTTNNINALRPGESAVTVLTSPTARILFVFTVICRAGDLLLLTAPGQTDALARHLRGQIFFMDQVKVTDVGDAWARLRLVGPDGEEHLKQLGLHPAPAPNAWVSFEDTVVLAQPDFGVPGYELLAPADRAEGLAAVLTAGSVQPVDDDAYHVRRVELGRPAPGAELVDDYSPLESGLAWACAENKGCYTGQEIIARQITYDKVTKALVGLMGVTAFQPGDAVTVDGRDVGFVTSTAVSPAVGPIALAVVKRPHNSPGTAVVAGVQTATIAALPFVTA